LLDIPYCEILARKLAGLASVQLWECLFSAVMVARAATTGITAQIFHQVFAKPAAASQINKGGEHPHGDKKQQKAPLCRQYCIHYLFSAWLQSLLCSGLCGAGVIFIVVACSLTVTAGVIFFCCAAEMPGFIRGMLY